MFLSIATTHRPATNLGFLLHKHPERVHETDLGFGKAFVAYPEASEDRCEAALILDIDPIGLVRGRGSAEGLLESQYAPVAVSSRAGFCASIDALDRATARCSGRWIALQI